ncbi:MAG: bifunctional folylpolyglutamate synthase/dihydrofolate synthase [Nitrospiraceae bacterium]|nr:bifunctional folylpolyglutamate synthase/dihydrofolate synthase [Nitrospiraceae bacterium]
MTHLDYLFDLERHGVKLGLDNIRRLLDAAGQPQDRYATVHVAGTNGKGSVVAMLDAIARAAGYTVGRFTSPHLIDVSERFVVGGLPITHDALLDQIAHFRAIAETMNPPPTFFEMNTAIALRWFEQVGVDLAIVEVGMGGRFDSTNVLTPVAAAVTNIGIEHVGFLGDTLAKIAFEKAGIIKPGVPVAIGNNEPEAREVLLARAAELDSPAYMLGRDFQSALEGATFDHQFRYESPGLTIGPCPLALAGAPQGENAAVAVALAERLGGRFPRLDEPAIVAGLGAARWPCRLERVLEDPPVIIDVAHNPAGARTLVRELPPCVVVLAVSSDKDAAGMVAAMDPLIHTLILTQFEGSRALPLDRLRDAAGGRPCQCVGTLPEAIEQGLALANDAQPLLITGSVFAAGEARRYLIDAHEAPPLAF